MHFKLHFRYKYNLFLKTIVLSTEMETVTIFIEIYKNSNDADYLT